MMISSQVVCRTLTSLWSMRVRGKTGYIIGRSKHILAGCVVSGVFIGMSRKIFVLWRKAREPFSFMSFWHFVLGSFLTLKLLYSQSLFPPKAKTTMYTFSLCVSLPFSLELLGYICDLQISIMFLFYSSFFLLFSYISHDNILDNP